MDKELDKLRIKYGDPVLESTYSEYKDKCPSLGYYYRTILEERRSQHRAVICCMAGFIIALGLIVASIFRIGFGISGAIMVTNALHAAVSSRISFLQELRWVDRFHQCIERYLEVSDRWK